VGVLLITCAVTGKEFSTGLEIDQAKVSKLFDIEASAHCPHCRSEHKWRPRDARYVDAIPPGDWIENKD
jgi:hypothetical protein